MLVLKCTQLHAQLRTRVARLPHGCVQLCTIVCRTVRTPCGRGRVSDAVASVWLIADASVRLIDDASVWLIADALNGGGVWLIADASGGKYVGPGGHWRYSVADSR